MEYEYTLEELKNVPEIITELYYLSEGKGNGKEIFERSRTFLRGTEFEDIEFDENMESEELDELIYDMLTAIEYKIPDDKVVSLIAGLDMDVFDAFYSDELHKLHPELLGIALRKRYDETRILEFSYVEYSDRETLLNNIKLTEGYLKKCGDDIWSRFFVNGVWAELTAEEQAEHFDEVLEMIDSEKLDERYDKEYRKINLLLATHLELREKVVSEAIDILSKNKINFYDYSSIKSLFSRLIRNVDSDVQENLFKQVMDNILDIDKLYSPEQNVGLKIMEKCLEVLDPDIIERNSQEIFDKIDTMIDKLPAELRRDEEAVLWNYREYFSQDRDLTYIPCRIDKTLVDQKINFSEAKEYLLFVLSRDKYALTNNAFVNHIYQALNLNLLDKYGLAENEIDEIRGLYESAEIGKDDVEPDMSKYEEKVSSMQEMEGEEFKSFCNDLKVLKNLHSRLPEKYCDYIIKQKLTENSYLNENLYEHIGILERAFEDKTSYILKSCGLGEYMIHVTDFHGTKKKAYSGTYGFFNKDGRVALSSDKIEILSLQKFDALDMVFHECRHAVQDKHLAEGDFVNPKEYVMLKEKIIRDRRPEYYYKNYEYNSLEIDARLAGFRDTIKYLKRLGFSEQEIMKERSATLEKYKEYFREHQMTEMKKYDTNIFLKKDKDDSEKSLNEMFGEVIRENPQILKEHPVFALEFNEDGTRKSRIGVLSKFDDILDEIKTDKSKVRSSNFRVYQEILKDYTGMDTKTVIKEVEDAVNLQLKNKPFEKILDRIVEKGGLRLFSESMKTGTIELNPEDTDEQKKKNFERLKAGLEAYSKSYPDRTASKKIEEELNRCNSLGKIEISEINIDMSSVTNRTQSDDDGER